MKAFPTAEGFGAQTKGGRGGKVLFVDNLSGDPVPGSLMWALTTPGDRYIIPRVSGTITLKSLITTAPGGITLAMQCSPGGLQIRGAQNANLADGIMFSYSEIIIRGARDREGGPGEHDAGVGLIVYAPNSTNRITNVIMDHGSYEWGIDAPMQVYGYVDKITLQNMIVAEGASNFDPKYNSDAGHKGDHEKVTGDISILRSLYASNGSRNPLVQQARTLDFRNNVVSNWGGNNGGQFGEGAPGAISSVAGNIVNNVYIPGPDSQNPAMVLCGGPIVGGTTKVFVKGNWGPVQPKGGSDEYADVKEIDTYFKSGGAYGTPVPASYKATSEYPVPDTTTLPTDKVLEYVLNNAGARAPFVDSADAGVIQRVLSNTGNIGAIGSGGPWPDLATGAPQPPKDSNNDGCPDYWNVHFGIDPMEDIAHVTDPTNGYPHIENWMNWLAGDFPDLVIDTSKVTLTDDSGGGTVDPDPTDDPLPIPPIQTAVSSIDPQFIMVGLAILAFILWQGSGD